MERVVEVASGEDKLPDMADVGVELGASPGTWVLKPRNKLAPRCVGGSEKFVIVSSSRGIGCYHFVSLQLKNILDETYSS
jgi:hypothetical protein